MNKRPSAPGKGHGPPVAKPGPGRRGAARKGRGHAEGPTAILAVSDAAPFLLEWVAYHRLIGFTRLLVFSHACSDGSDRMLDALAAADLVEHHPNDASAPGLPEQPEARAFARALPMLASGDWALPLAIHEFLAIRTGEGRLADLLTALPGDATAVALRVRLIGSGGAVAATAEPRLARFTAAAAETPQLLERARAIRMLFRPEGVGTLGGRRPWYRPEAMARQRIVDGGSRDRTAELLRAGWTLPPDQAALRLAQVNDYALGAREDMLARLMPDAEALRDEVARFDRADIRDDVLLRWAAPLADELARLRAALPDAAAIEAEADAAYRARIAAARAALTQTSPELARSLLGGGEGEAAKPARAARPTAPHWLEDLRGTPGRRGFYRSTPEHALVFVDRGSERLVVGFDNLASVRDNAPVRRDGWGYAFAASRGWSHLGVLAFTPHWFREAELHEALRGLAAEGFFARFGSVTLMGTSMGAFAACAFAPLAPGCTVVALSPQATLDPARVPWEARWQGAQRQDWGGDFNDAVTGAAAAGRAFLVSDPLLEVDRRHIGMFDGLPNVTHLPAPLSGHKSALFLRRAEILWTVIEQAITGELTPARYARLRRQARLIPFYIRPLAEHLADRGKPGLLRRVIAHLQAKGAADMAASLQDRYAPLLDGRVSRMARDARAADDDEDG